MRSPAELIARFWLKSIIAMREEKLEIIVSPWLLICGFMHSVEIMRLNHWYTNAIRKHHIHKIQCVCVHTPTLYGCESVAHSIFMPRFIQMEWPVNDDLIRGSFIIIFQTFFGSPPVAGISIYFNQYFERCSNNAHNLECSVWCHSNKLRHRDKEADGLCGCVILCWLYACAEIERMRYTFETKLNWMKLHFRFLRIEKCVSKQSIWQLETIAWTNNTICFERMTRDSSNFAN